METLICPALNAPRYNFIGSLGSILFIRMMGTVDHCLLQRHHGILDQT